MADAVDTFIKEKVLPEYQPLVERFRKLVKSEFPELSEEMRGGTEAYYGTPVYRLKRIVVVISPTKNGITYAFSEGKKLEDKYKMLEGVGNKTLNIRLSKLEDFDDEKMAYYLRQAIEIDKMAK